MVYKCRQTCTLDLALNYSFFMHNLIMILPIQGCNMYHTVAVKTNRMISGRCTCFQASLLAGLVLWVRGCGWPEIWRQSRPQQQLRWIVVAAAVAAVEVRPEVPTWPQSAVNSWPDHNNLKLLRDVLQDLGIAKKGGGVGPLLRLVWCIWHSVQRST